MAQVQQKQQQQQAQQPRRRAYDPWAPFGFPSFPSMFGPHAHDAWSFPHHDRMFGFPSLVDDFFQPMFAAIGHEEQDTDMTSQQQPQRQQQQKGAPVPAENDSKHASTAATATGSGSGSTTVAKRDDNSSSSSSTAVATRGATPASSSWIDRFLGPSSANDVRLIALDVVEKEKAYEVSAELAGVQKNDISVSVSDGVMKIRGERRRDATTRDGDKAVRVERHYGAVERSLRLPRDTDPLGSGVTASYENGVLRVTVPKVSTASRDPVHNVHIA